MIPISYPPNVTDFDGAVQYNSRHETQSFFFRDNLCHDVPAMVKITQVHLAWRSKNCWSFRARIKFFEEQASKYGLELSQLRSLRLISYNVSGN